MAVEYYFNVRTGEVEEGKRSNPAGLLGPYPTREEAEQALAKVEQRNEAWDEMDEEDDDWGSSS